MIRSRILMLMKRRPFRAVLADLAEKERDVLLHADGSVNASAMARVLGVTQPSISRAIKDPNYQPKKDTIDKVCKIFGVSAAQARGEDTLITGPNEVNRLSPRTQQLAHRFEALPASQKKVIETMLTALEASLPQRDIG